MKIRLLLVCMSLFSAFCIDAASNDAQEDFFEEELVVYDSSLDGESNDDVEVTLVARNESNESQLSPSAHFARSDLSVIPGVGNITPHGFASSGRSTFLSPVALASTDQSSRSRSRSSSGIGDRIKRWVGNKVQKMMGGRPSETPPTATDLNIHLSASVQDLRSATQSDVAGNDDFQPSEIHEDHSRSAAPVLISSRNYRLTQQNGVQSSAEAIRLSNEMTIARPVEEVVPSAPRIRRLMSGCSLAPYTGTALQLSDDAQTALHLSGQNQQLGVEDAYQIPEVKEYEYSPFLALLDEQDDLGRVYAAPFAHAPTPAPRLRSAIPLQNNDVWVEIDALYEDIMTSADSTEPVSDI